MVLEVVSGILVVPKNSFRKFFLPPAEVTNFLNMKLRPPYSVFCAIFVALTAVNDQLR